jgi:asparagine synthase (glutamine-hydrolysing)
MCGIFGSVGDPLAPNVVARVASVLHHRGPESNGIANLAGATLVHTRLKIIDLSPAGAQPMANEDDTVWVTFNGEIYNFVELRQQLEAKGHRFRSQADTEVIVHGYEEWGDGVVERLDGMFAFGVWDVRNQRLLLARDRTGKKPLFYGRHAGRLLFGSEIKALFAAGMPPEVDHGGVAGLLAYGYAPPPGSLYRGVQQLPPAHHLTLEAGKPGSEPRVSRYWQVSFAASGEAPPSEDQAAERIRYLLDEAVRKRLVADVPVGAFLSGGLDSTIVVGLMARHSSRVRTFSIGFTGDPRYDETHFARMAAQSFGTEHTEFKVGPTDFELVEKLVWHHDGPFGDSSAIPTYVVSRLTRAEVTVALSGDGGDELFAGYLRFWAAANTERIPAPLRRLAGLAAPLLPGGTGSRSLPARARRMLSAIERPLGDRVTFWNSYFAFTHADLMRPELRPPAHDTLGFHRQFFQQSGASPLAEVLNHNFGTYLPYDLLVKTDRVSMAHALETRSPFLDTALIEYVAGLPDSYKLRGVSRPTTKYILRKAFADLMPAPIRSRGKMGFGLPLGTWFRNELRSYIADRVCAPDARIRDLVQPQVVEQVFREHIEGRADHEHQIWLLLTMELWLRNLPRLSSPWQHDADRGSVSVHGPGVADVAPAAPPASLVSPAHP